MTKFHNSELIALAKSQYSLVDLDAIAQFFRRHGTLMVTPLPNGLYSAVSGNSASTQRYRYVWLRDNIMVAHSRRVIGDMASASVTLGTLRDFYLTHRHRFDDIISGKSDPKQAMERPHIRFDGDTLMELSEKWSHAQNDALGYLLWLTFSMANEQKFIISPADCVLAKAMCQYFEAIQYWQDADNGHWEEAAKVECSSIGPVVAGVRELRKWIGQHSHLAATLAEPQFLQLLAHLTDRGMARLRAALPKDTPSVRDVDAALLFLIYPLRVVEGKFADEILQNVADALEGDFGVRRYRGDSYWCADYKRLLSRDQLTADFSDAIQTRDQLLRPGTEAQWALFDPILSSIYAERYAKDGNERDYERQVHYFNRALGQLTANDFDLDGLRLVGQCPEAYYLADSGNGQWVPNDHVPLQWTQANLAVAFEYLKRTSILRHSQ
jgi:phosphorylase kinase alpha/beta subunit